MSRRVHVDRFATGLADLTRRQQRDSDAVIAVLRRTGMFSCFEASDNPDIAATMTRLCKTRLTTDHESVGYPWTKVVAIDGVPLAIKEESKG